MSQHATKKCKPFDDITNTVSSKIHKMNDNTEAVADSQQDTPSSSHAARLENELRQYKERVDELEAILEQHQQAASVSFTSRLEIEVRQYEERIGELKVMLQQQKQQEETTSLNMRKLKDELHKYREKVCDIDRESLAEIMNKCCKINVEQES